MGHDPRLLPGWQNRTGEPRPAYGREQPPSLGPDAKVDILALSRNYTDNLGDLVCSPVNWFDYPTAVQWDVKPTKPRTVPPKARAYIFGGGGITAMTRWYVDREKITGPKVAWGIGEHKRDNFFVNQTRLTDFDLVGCRDYLVKGTEWVPCPSCMSPAFDEKYEEEHESVRYWNARKCNLDDMPTLTNRHTMAEAIAHIASGRRVYTNSYHGMYWAKLLGKEVVIENPYCSKFFQMKPASLEECREANIKFDEKVRDVLFCNRSA